MVHTWLHEVSTNQNFYADLQLQHFYRYKKNSHKKIYLSVKILQIFDWEKLVFLPGG